MCLDFKDRDKNMLILPAEKDKSTSMTGLCAYIFLK